jgi:hypothetical protein
MVIRMIAMPDSRLTLSVDRQRRISVGKLGFEEGIVVAEPLPDGSGWALRPAVVLTEAEADVLRHPESRENLETALAQMRAGKVVGRTRPPR